MNVLAETWTGLLDLLYPPKCLVCGNLDPETLCEVCRAGFLPVDPPLCRRCGNTLTEGACRDCASGVPRFVERVRSAGQFSGSLRTAILRFKYRGKRELAAPLGAYLAEYLSASPFGSVRFDLLVPVPLHPSRLRQREYNQAALLAQEAGRALGIPVAEHALSRTRKTGVQAELSRDRRSANVEGAFSMRDYGAVTGRTVLLIDDVVTTCNTVDECARVLLDAGAKAVYAASLAREV